MTDRGIVISSSGVRLTYEVGVLRGLVDILNASDTAWKHVYGTSGGALLSSFLCMYPIGQERQAVEDMEKMMISFAGENGMRPYFPFGMAQGLLTNSSLYDSDFIRNLVYEHIKPEKIRDSGRHLYIVAVGYSSAQGKVYTEKDWEIIQDAIIASCSIPFVFPPKAIKDIESPTGVNYFGDGGMTDFLPLERAVLNPSIGFLDVIISVGDPDARVMDLAPNGKFPTVSQVVNAMLESFYKYCADHCNNTIARVNSLLTLKKILGENLGNYNDIPQNEKVRLIDSIKNIKRKTHISARIFKPVSPFSLTATGHDENISKHLWDVGICTARHVLNEEIVGGFSKRVLKV